MWFVEHLDIDVCISGSVQTNLWFVVQCLFLEPNTSMLVPNLVPMLRESQPQAERWSGDRYIKQVSLQWFLMLVNYPSGILITCSIHLFFRNHC